MDLLWSNAQLSNVSSGGRRAYEISTSDIRRHARRQYRHWGLVTKALWSTGTFKARAFPTVTSELFPSPFRKESIENWSLPNLGWRGGGGHHSGHYLNEPWDRSSFRIMMKQFEDEGMLSWVSFRTWGRLRQGKRGSNHTGQDLNQVQADFRKRLVVCSSVYAPWLNGYGNVQKVNRQNTQ